MAGPSAAIEKTLDLRSRKALDSRAFLGTEVAPKIDGSFHNRLTLGFDGFKNGSGRESASRKVMK